MIEENELSSIIKGCAIEVHKQLGQGLLGPACQECWSNRHFYFFKQTKYQLDL